MPPTKEMNYETLKKMKDVGFPFRKIETGRCVPDGPPFATDILGKPYPYIDFNWEGLGDAQHYYIPSLEELIQACGDKLFSLTRHGDVWQTNFIEGFSGETAGRTPSEAVANLWLKINGK